MENETAVKKPSPSSPAREAYKGYRELGKLQSPKKESELQGPEQFWEQRKNEIAQGLRERYSCSDHPEVEIIVPVYKNALDLPLLTYGLSRQNLTDLQNVQLTFVMHNNTAKPEVGRARDESWDQLEYLESCGVQLRILTLDDPLLSGPYISWQYGMLKSTGEICAVLDADSMPPQSWVSRITAPLRNKPSAIFSGGVRVLFGTERKIEALSYAYYLAATIKSVFAPPGPNLAKAGRFAGGQAAYRVAAVRPMIESWCGSPQGDGTLAHDILHAFGDDAFQFADAPVENRADEHRNSTNFWKKIAKPMRMFLPGRLKQLFTEKPLGPEDDVRTLERYCPWSKPLIAALKVSGRLTGTQVKERVMETARAQHFENNAHLNRFLETHAFAECTKHEELLQLVQVFANEVVRPTFFEYLEASEQPQDQAFSN